MTHEFILGQDAGVLFLASAINDGEPFGFLLYRDEYRVDLEIVQKFDDSILIVRDVDEDGNFDNSILVALRIGDEQQTLMGGIREVTEAEERFVISELLKLELFTLITEAGVYSNVFIPTGGITETQFDIQSVILLRLKSTSGTLNPPDTDLYLASRFHDENDIAPLPENSRMVDEATQDPVGDFTGYARGD